ELDRLLSHGIAGPRCMAGALRQSIDDGVRSAIPKADGIPTTWLADDAEIRSVPQRNFLRPVGPDDFLAHSADNCHSAVQLLCRHAGRGHKGGQWTLGIYRASTPQHAIDNFNRDMPRYGIDMPQQHDV